MRKILITAFLCPLLTHCMPPRNTIPPLTVGDAYTAFTIHNVVNNPQSSIAIPAKGGNIYILNFVSIACRSCAKDYARLQALQKQYSSYLHVILVTSENEARVNAFLKENKIGRALRLPVATSDSVLASWFPHKYLPHTVWLQNGKVIAITDPQYLDENNIEILLMGRSPKFPLKQDAIDYDPAQPLLSYTSNTIAQNSVAPYYALFSPAIPGLTAGFTRINDTAAAAVKTTILNLPIIQCYLHAYNLRPDFPSGQTVLNVRDTSRYCYNQNWGYKLAWTAQNTWCYQSVLPASLSPVQQQQKLITDLDFYFGIHSCFKKIKAAAFALKTFDSSGTKPLLTSGTSPQYISLSNLVWYINHHWFGIPAFNETGITKKGSYPSTNRSFQPMQPCNLISNNTACS